MPKKQHIHASSQPLENAVNEKYAALKTAAADLAETFSNNADQITLDGIAPIKLKTLLEDAVYQGAIPEVMKSPHIGGVRIKAAELFGMDRSKLRRIMVRLFPEQEAA